MLKTKGKSASGIFRELERQEGRREVMEWLKAHLNMRDVGGINPEMTDKIEQVTKILKDFATVCELSTPDAMNYREYRKQICQLFEIQPDESQLLTDEKQQESVK